MKKKIVAYIISIVVLASFTACFGSKEAVANSSSNREIILYNDNTNEQRNLLLAEDIRFFKEKLPKLHKNPFSYISKKKFNERTDQLIENIDSMSNNQVLTELNKIIASIGDAHTTINIWDGYSYPLQFWLFDGNVYVINADTSLKEMMFSQVLKIDGVDIDTVTKQLTTLISHENESWVLAMLPGYLQSPGYLYGLGTIKNEKQAVFTVQKDGQVKDYTVSALTFGESADFTDKRTENILIGEYDKYYSYEYFKKNSTCYFEYNMCAEMEDQSFKDFNKKMFDAIESHNTEKIIIDLRCNTGGNSEILNPFTKCLKSYIKKNEEVKVYILIGRNTFSSGMFAIYRIKEAAPEAVSVGEPTGGALDCYGEVKMMNLPNSQIPISYSTKYFDFNKKFHYKNKGVGTFLPDISIQPSIEEFRNRKDAVLDYALAD